MFAPSAERVNDLRHDLRQQQFLSVAALLGSGMGVSVVPQSIT